METEKKQNQQADRHNSGKTRWTLLDFEALQPYAQVSGDWLSVNWDLLQETVNVMEFGARKYARDNWKKGMPYLMVADSFIRHLRELSIDNRIDAETNLSQWAHIMCNLMFLSRYTAHNPEFDDRTHSAIEVNTITTLNEISTARHCIAYMYELMSCFLSGTEINSETGHSILGELMFCAGLGYKMQSNLAAISVSAKYEPPIIWHSADEANI